MLCKYTQNDGFSFGKSSHWWDAECENAKHVKVSSLRKFRLTCNDGDLAVYKNLLKFFKLLCKTKRLAYNGMTRTQLVESRKDAKKCWSILKSCSKIKSNSIPISHVQLSDHFHTLLSINQSILSTDSSFLEKYRNYHTCDDLNLPITEIEVSRSVQS